MRCAELLSVDHFQKNSYQGAFREASCYRRFYQHCNECSSTFPSTGMHVHSRQNFVPCVASILETWTLKWRPDEHEDVPKVSILPRSPMVSVNYCLVSYFLRTDALRSLCVELLGPWTLYSYSVLCLGRQCHPAPRQNLAKSCQHRILLLPRKTPECVLNVQHSSQEWNHSALFL